MTRKYGAKKDANHREIVAALEAGGCSVLDISHLGGGLPDLVVAWRRITMLVEIKNPKTGYGRRGANKIQRAWAAAWPSPVYIIKSLDDVQAFVNGQFQKIERYGRTPEEAVRLVLGEAVMA